MSTQSANPCELTSHPKTPTLKSKILVVGAGGIGCEILKNLCVSGFQDIEVIDLDTIDVSNLNRQFLFRKEHVGKSKAVVARESIISFNSNVNIKAYHDSIFNQEYGVNFFKRFDLVLNALDNRAARNHVNRMCLAADIPLVESGTAGYSGQVELIKKGVTQCYECQPKPQQRSYPGCTIRNTPSEPVHCIVWAKHLFNQLFGEEDPDQDVSPDTEDPEVKKDGAFSETESGDVKRKSTRQWAQEVDYDPEKLFNKFFRDDINYLLSMENLWKTRTPPVPLSWEKALNREPKISQVDSSKSLDMQVLSISKYTQMFASTVNILKKEVADKKYLMWDKDDTPAMDFVTACANIRAFIFSISQKSKFAIKSIAGNIIPAIATANALIAGVAVLYAFRVLRNEFENCPTIYLRQKSVYSKVLLASDNGLQKPNPNCYVCSSKPIVNVFVNVNKMLVNEFETEILKNTLNMVAPDAILDGKGVVVISSEEGETEINSNKKLCEVGIVDGSILKVDDFLQNYELTINISHYEAKEKDDPAFKFVANPDDLKAKQSDGIKNGVTATKNNSPNQQVHKDNDDLVICTTDDDFGASSSKKRKLNPIEEDDDLIMLDEQLE
ncbi:SUMO-activating enzyme subunit 2 [Tribolium madens]|uniref:SUMO-activating enzyme subunit 2 n=1 Tax=Tribolium madens TaxID=41895 RepID=UPI001CF7323F|nr:SUMO-activating enzyme subunit 2 [Tribolium madens]